MPTRDEDTTDEPSSSMDLAYAHVPLAATTPDATSQNGTVGCLVMKLRDGDAVTIGDNVEVILRHARNGRADVAFKAQKDLKIRRSQKPTP